MTLLMEILLCVCVVQIAVIAWLCGKVKIQQLDIEKLYDAVAQTVKDQATMRRTIADKEDDIREMDAEMESAYESVEELRKKVEAQAKTIEAYGENINSLNAAIENLGEGMGERVEKLWNDGLQVLATWNPLDLIEGNGGK